VSFKPNPKQALVLWKLLITQEMPVKSKLSPELKHEELRELEQAGLIRIVGRKQLREEGLIDLKGTGQHIVLADKAWDWALDNFDVEIYSSKYTRSVVPLIEELLRKVGASLKFHEISLSEFVQPQLIADSEDASVTPTSLEDEIREAYSKVSDGSYDVGVRLSELRQHLGDLRRIDIDKTLGEMELAGKLVLMPIDDPQAISSEDEKAAIDVGGHKRHIVHMKG